GTVPRPRKAPPATGTPRPTARLGASPRRGYRARRRSAASRAPRSAPRWGVRRRAPCVPLRRSSRPLAPGQGSLALDTPAIARESTIGAHHAVARDGDGERVRGAGLRHGAHRLGRTDARGELAVAHRGTCRHLAQRLPDALLEGRAAQVEG